MTDKWRLRKMEKCEKGMIWRLENVFRGNDPVAVNGIEDVIVICIFSLK